MPGNPFEKKWGTLAKIFMVSATMTHEGWRYTPFTLEIHVDHAFFEDTKVLFQSILHRCAKYGQLQLFCASQSVIHLSRNNITMAQNWIRLNGRRSEFGLG